MERSKTHRRDRGYKIAIWILSLVIIIQGIFIIIMARPKKPPEVPVEVPIVIRGEIAIVVDDWGYNLNNLPIIEQIKYPLTVAILPNLKHSQAIAKKLHKRGLEIILHLPMEPHKRLRLEQNTIMTSMDEPSIINIIRQDLANVVYAKGVSNHMGSKATKDLRTMRIIFKELKRKRLYFLDSLVSAKSVCSDLAKKIHLGFTRRDVFLDNIEDPVYIRKQIHKLKVRARVYGQAVGISHDRRITLEVLKEIMPQLEKQGYKFVFVSEVVK